MSNEDVRELKATEELILATKELDKIMKKIDKLNKDVSDLQVLAFEKQDEIQKISLRLV